MARGDHTAWTPPSLPDSIVLLGGSDDSGEIVPSAEIVPGKKQRQSSDYFPPTQVEHHSHSITVGVVHAESRMDNRY